MEKIANALTLLSRGSPECVLLTWSKQSQGPKPQLRGFGKPPGFLASEVLCYKKKSRVLFSCYGLHLILF